jgi:hypothetical protein
MEKIQLLHPEKSAPRIDRDKYELMKTALLDVIPASKEGVCFSDLPTLLEQVITPDDLSNLGSLMWYTTTVKLDLEARGLIERIAGTSPQRVRRT